ncbi:fluoride efflux transporter FluC [Arthrobacter silvisoli]|uniref:fluoride efflux transporter FluC n=1 Tax=Arthrobacter silvisoli TaxID=2291022 RepID=UPI001FEAA9B7|nr:CrcB family protein [Arthrobacter silvisoli]
MSRPLHLHPQYLALVAGGGVLGALSRYGLGLSIPSPGQWPLPTLLINLSGAFVLGWLLESLAWRGPDEGRRRFIRLTAGTGFLGAFTTYSTFSVETVQLFDAGRAADAFGYLAASLLGGTLATFAGIALGQRLHKGRTGVAGGAS